MATPQPLKIDKFLGLNNVDPPEEQGPGEFSTLTNVDIDDKGRQLRRRKGYTSVYSGNCHSLFNDGRITLFREGTDLKRLNSDYSATTLRSNLPSNQRVAYLPLMDRIYYSDGAITGVIQDQVSRSWGLPIPGIPTLADTAGELPEGRYQVALTFVRNDGQEGGSSTAAFIDITSGGIAISNIPVSTDSTVSYVNIYVSGANGEVMFRIGTVANGVTSATYRGGSGSIPLKTQFLSPPPPGHLLGWFNGRVYLAQDQILWYSEPYAYELFNLAHNHFVLDSRITMVSAVYDGIWVSTQESTDFIAAGENGMPVKKINAADYGAIEGTAVDVEMNMGGRKVSGLLWASPQGICFGGNEGFFQNLTEERFYFASSVSGTGLLRQANGMNQYILSMLNASESAFNPYS